MSTFFEKITGSSSKTSSPDFNEDTTGEEGIEERKPTLVKKIALAAKDNNQFIQRNFPREPNQVKTAVTATHPEGQGDEEEGELTVDIYDGGDAIVIQSTVAGVKPEDLDVSLTNDSITIHGRRQRPEDIHDDNYYYKDCLLYTSPSPRD